jgi:hypothetical protein
VLQGVEGEARMDLTSPELGLTLRHYGWSRGQPVPPVPADGDVSLTLLVYVETGIAGGAPTVWEAGPAMLLEPQPADVRQFGRDLRSETELALAL